MEKNSCRGLIMISFAKQNYLQWKIGRKEINIPSHSFPKGDIKAAQ